MTAKSALHPPGNHSSRPASRRWDGRRLARQQTPCLRNMAALLRHYDPWMEDGGDASLADVQMAVDCYRHAHDLARQLHGLAARSGVPLSPTGAWHDHLDLIRAFVAGGGWQ